MEDLLEERPVKGKVKREADPEVTKLLGEVNDLKDTIATMRQAVGTFFHKPRDPDDIQQQAGKLVERWLNQRFPGAHPYRVYDKRYVTDPAKAPIYYSEYDHTANIKQVREEYDRRFKRRWMGADSSDPLVIERVFDHASNK